MAAMFTGELSFLSNFHPSAVTLDRTTYPTVEHAYQAAKTLDMIKRLEIQAAETPNQAKKLGQRVKLRPDWEILKISVMEELLREKFVIPELRQALLATGDLELVETNWWHDNVWGDCYCTKCMDTPGKNILGRLLMKIRQDARDNDK